MCFDVHLVATSRLVFSDTELKVGSAYMAKIEAYKDGGCSGKPIDVSNWTQPVVIKCQMVCSEYPLLLFKTLFSMTPSDPFQYFLDMHCAPLKDAPSMVLTFTN